MTDREKLIELLFDVPEVTVYNRAAPKIANHLIANGVTFAKDTDAPGKKPPTDLTGKCGSCVYAKPTIAFGGSRSWVECTNKEHLRIHCKSHCGSVRQRTTRACSCYRPLPEPPKED